MKIEAKTQRLRFFEFSDTNQKNSITRAGMVKVAKFGKFAESISIMLASAELEMKPIIKATEIDCIKTTT